MVALATGSPAAGNWATILATRPAEPGEVLGADPPVRMALDRGEPLGREARSAREQPLGVDRLVEGPDRRRTDEQRDRMGGCVLEQAALVDGELAVREREPLEQRRPFPGPDPAAAEANVAAAVPDEARAVIAVGVPALDHVPPPIGVERLEPRADQPGGRGRRGIEAERAAAAERDRGGASQPWRGEHDGEIVERLLTARRLDGPQRLEPRWRRHGGSRCRLARALELGG